MSTLAQEANAFIDVEDIRLRLGNVLNRQSDQMARLGQLLAGLSHIDAESLPAHGAGYGSAVVVKNIDTGAVLQVTLMTGALVDIEANHVSLASPVGQALLGRGVGDDVVVHTPQGVVRYRVIRLVTLHDLLRTHERRR